MAADGHMRCVARREPDEGGMSTRVRRAMCALTLVAVAACSAGSPADVLEATTSGNGREIGLSVNTCSADLSSATTESDTEVIVEVSARNADPHAECLDSTTVVLDRPLRDRPVIDAHDGRVVPVRPRE